MVKCRIVFFSLLSLIISIFFTVSLNAYADDGIKGWEIDSEYNSLYHVSEVDRLKGSVKKIITVVPLDGMAKGVGLILQDGDGEKVTVHIGPESFIGTNTGLKRGDQVKIRGAWAEIDGEDVFMAAKIKKGNYFSLKVRLTKNGKPFWTMDAEELARERAAQ